MNKIDSLKDTLNYDIYLIDIWGVVHNGERLFPHVIEAFTELKKLKKKIYLFTNSPLLEKDIIGKLTFLGLKRELYDNIISAGETFSHSVNNIEDDANPLVNIKHFFPKFKYYYIGLAEEFISDLEGVHVQDLNEADVILLSNLPADFDYHNMDHALKEILKRNLPMICLNPDLNVVVGSESKLVYCAGYIAKLYEDMGGEVIFFGKPHPAMYSLAIEKSACENHKVLAIGDNLHTDILGALKFGIDVCLVMTGVANFLHKEENLTIELESLKNYVLNKNANLRNSSIMVLSEIKW